MNLSAMTLAELAELQRAFELIHRGTSILSGLACNQSEFETSIDMTPGELVVISTHFRMPEAMYFGPPPEFVIEGPGEVVRGPFLETATHVGEHSVTEMPEAVAEAGESPAQISDAAEAAGPGDGVGGDAPPVAGPMVKTGPLSDVERAEIERLDAEGLSRREIAERLGRRTQAVALYLQGRANAPRVNAPAPKEYQAAQPALAAEQAAVADAVGADAAVEAPEAAMAAPVGEIAEGGTAEATPEPAPVAGGAGSAVPPPATLLEREIWHHLNQLGHVAPFSPELDLEICEALSAGHKAGAIATDLGLDSQVVVDRFRRLSFPVRDLKDRVKPDGQARLVAELRRRVKWMRDRAA